MRREIVKEGERKNFSLKAPPGKQRLSCRKKGFADYIGGKEVYVSSIEVRTIKTSVEIVVYEKGSFEEIKKGRDIIRWNFVPFSKISQTSVTINLE
ncbi:MAG: hypothetical protein E7004_06685 [Alphaproteobacteria bacterium]|nr:hypothetical protein [Alphaproteobacteria bacterium]